MVIYIITQNFSFVINKKFFKISIDKIKKGATI